VIDDVDDAEVIRQCLWAAVNGPFFPDWEFDTLFGFHRDEIRRIAEAWPNWDDDDERRDAVNNTFNNLIRYPHGRWDVWHDYISPTEVELRRVYARFSWRAVGPISQGYFDSLS
jgi:hypothetical protein